VGIGEDTAEVADWSQSVAMSGNHQDARKKGGRAPWSVNSAPAVLYGRSQKTQSQVHWHSVERFAAPAENRRS
jgi:hypothetical protein